ncbi:MAG: energy transducer TonB [Saprospiraceae bacterium]|nr:energy transducer TonB [Saprospiraceae bacterium]
MKNTIYFGIVLIMLSSCHLYQTSQFNGKYNSFLEEDETEIKTEYHTIFSKKSDGSYVFRQFFPETKQITELITYASDKNTKNGKYARWSDDGILRSEGNYKNNQEIGQWIDGESKGKYLQGKKEGQWIATNKKGQLSAVYQYINGIRHGEFIIYDTLGQIVNKGIYRADTIFSQSVISEKTTEGPLKKIKIMPMMKSKSCAQMNYDERKNCSDIAMLTYITKKLKYPIIARDYGVQGTAIVQFVIDTDGSVVDINVVRGICQSIKDEVTRVVKSFPAWDPGIIDGKPVKVLYTLPVKFKLERFYK